jgi:hypothetical protein
MDAVERRRGGPEQGGKTQPMRRALAGLAVALCLGAAAPASSLGAHSLKIGIADDGVLFHDPDAARVVAKWKALGIDVARVHVRWVSVAPRPDARRPPRGFDASDPGDRHYSWGAVDHAVALLRDAGIEPILAVTGSGPVWSSSRPSLDNPRWRPSPRRFAAFATAVARRYRDDVTDYILWNEPDQPGWLQPQFRCRGTHCTPESPHIYRHLVNAAAPAIRRVDPTAQVLAGALAPRGSDPHARNSAMRPLTFLRAFGCVNDRYHAMRHGRCAGFHAPLIDGISYHPHGVLRSPSQRNPQRDEAAFADLGRLEFVIDRIAAHHGLRCTCTGRIPIHLTEFGYQTNPPDPYQGVSPAEQARWLQEAGYRAWRDPRIKTLVQYEWRDDPLQRKASHGPSAYAGWQSGLLYADSRPKPALSAFANPFFVQATPGLATVTLWGQVRPGDAHSVSVERRLPGRAWRTLETVETDAFGAFTTQLVLPGIAELRFAYDSDPPARPRAIASQPVTVRRSVGVVPPRR